MLIYFFLITIKRMTKQYVSTFKTNMAILDIDETRNYLFQEMKYNNLMSEKHKKSVSL